MIEYIEKEAALSLISRYTTPPPAKLSEQEQIVYAALANLYIDLQLIPKADVQSVVYAHKTINVGLRSYCSNCGRLAHMENFCSMCGATVKDGDTNG